MVRITNNKFVGASIIFIAIVLLALVLKTLQALLKPLAVALIFSFLIISVVRSAKKKGVPSWLTLTVIIIISILIVVGLGFLLQGKIAEINSALPGYEEGIKESVSTFYSSGESISFGDKRLNLREFLGSEEIGEYIIKIVSTVVNSLLGLISGLFLVIIFLIFIVPSHDAIVENIGKAYARDKKRFKTAAAKIEKAIQDYLRVKVLISLGTSIVSALILLFFGFDFIIVFALLFFALNFIPNIGSFIVVAAALAFYALNSGFGVGFFALAVLLIITQVIFGNILDPKLSGNKLKISPLVILLLLLFWGWVWGIVGLLISVPLTSILKIILEEGESTRAFAEMMG